MFLGASLAIACTAALPRSSFGDGLLLALDAHAKTVRPFEALPLELSVTNTGGEPLQIDNLPLHGEFLSDFLEIAQPDGVSRKLHQVQRRLQSAEGGSEQIVTLDAAQTHKFVLLLGSGGPERAPAFDATGGYKLVVQFAGARSNELVLECVPPPDRERDALERVRSLMSEGLLDAYYDGRLLLGRDEKPRQAEYERLAWLPGSTLYASQAKLALADRALALAAMETERKAAFVVEARSLLEAIGPGSALGHGGDMESYVGRRLVDLRKERGAAASSAR